MSPPRGQGMRRGMVVGWCNTWSGDVWCRGEHDTLDDVKATMGPRQWAAIDITEVTLEEADAVGVSMICNTCGRPIQAWLEGEG